MIQRRSHGLLVLAFAAVVIFFAGSTLFSQWQVTQLDDSATAIASVAAPRIEVLAAIRAEMHQLGQALTDYVALASQGKAADPERMRSSQQRLDADIDRYRALPREPVGREAWPQVEQSLLALRAGVERVTEEAGRGDAVRAQQILDLEVRPAIQAARAVLIQSIELNAEHAHALAIEIRSIRSRSSFIAYALNGISILLGGIVVALAIAEVRRYTQLLESQRQLLERRAEELELFAGRVAHDVLGPMSAASTFLMMLDRHLPSHQESKLRGGLERAKNGILRSKKIVDDLLEFARAGARPAPDARANVNEILEGLLRELGPVAHEGGVDLRTELPSDPCAVACRPGVLISMVENLVRNAIKYSADSATRQVTVRAAPKRSSVRVEVSDTGPGLSRAAQEVIFEPFVRAPGAEGKPGIGLGLATVKRLAEAHGGSVGVDSTPAHGCLFWFELPRSTLQSVSDSAVHVSHLRAPDRS